MIADSNAFGACKTDDSHFCGKTNGSYFLNFLLTLPGKVTNKLSTLIWRSEAKNKELKKKMFEGGIELAQVRFAKKYKNGVKE